MSEGIPGGNSKKKSTKNVFLRVSADFSSKILTICNKLIEVISGGILRLISEEIPTILLEEILKDSMKYLQKQAMQDLLK